MGIQAADLARWWHLAPFGQAVIDEQGVILQTPHDFRHQFATTLFREGVDITLIQSLLAHGQLRTTLRYVRKEHASLVKAANVMGKKYYGKDDDDTA